ncbi:MAG TPA: cysteine desulfurase-like protein [Gemmatimonadaceae bacterium]|jgi:cysteine desulfurase family protein (TIGR01976 family)|nr:cysteine desulfurase-like protein [Gemmatimonadaceae bacterium]
MLALDLRRAQFPALAREYNGQPVAYFDGPGGTQVPTVVSAAVTDYLLYHNANTHWVYPTSVETDAAIEGARSAFADLFHARSAEEIVFGNNMTTVTFHLARALGRAWGPGDEVVVTELDHQANVAPWTAIARERGITVRTVRFDPATGELDLDDLARMVGPRTRLVAVGAASNALGTVNDVRTIVGLAHAAGALAFVDAVHFTPHAVVDVQAWGADFLACSAYKMYGTHVGILYGRRDLLATLDVPKLAPAPEAPPERLETGTQNHEGIVGAGAAVDFLASLAPTGKGERGTRRERLVAAMTMLHEEGQALVARLWSGLAALPAVRLYGPGPDRPRTATLSFSVGDMDSGDVARRLVERGLFLSDGDFYASTVVERLGMERRGLVRAGCSCYTSVSEVDRLIHGVAALCD